MSGGTTMTVKIAASVLVILFAGLTGCSTAEFTGKDPNEESSSDSKALIAEADKQPSDPTDKSNESGESSKLGEEDISQSSANEEYVIEGASKGESLALQNCLTTFKDHPFGKRIKSFKTVTASISIGGKTTPINDTEKTEEPTLILIDAALNIKGQPTYNMLNPNGFYCIRYSLNIKTNLEINLSCSARLADSGFSLSIKSDVDENVSRNGIYIDSSVSVNSIEDDKENYSCVR